jgi:threonyl-tRNA synthetase
MEWVPIIVVIGEKEKESGKLAVRFRSKGKETKEMSLKEIENYIHKSTEGKPFRKLSLSMFLSKRPVFVG